ncbi:MAG: glycosyltransferase [Bacilli bacterium]|nr:glycosyltransferase [Bacilli bacterium]
MYNISCNKKYNNFLEIDTLEKRIKNLTHSNKKNIIYIKDVFDNSTFRYRTYNVIQAMEKSEKYHINCFLVEELKLLIALLSKIDLIVLQRCKWSFALENFIYIAKEKKIKICYDMDDLIYDPKYVPDYLENIGYYDEINIDVHFSLAARYQRIASLCDQFLVTTKCLKEQIENDFKKPVFIYKNFLNNEQEEIASEIIKQKEIKKDDDKFYIGYFSGSNSHVRDLETASDAIIKMIEKYNDVYFYIVGYMDLPKKLIELKNKGRVIVNPFVTYQELEYLIGIVDVNIIPLQNNLFNECKSELKYFEASIVNTVSVACNNSVYNEIIKDGENGFLANELEWFTKLEYIYLNRDKLNGIIKNARNYSIEKYRNKNQLKGLEELYTKMIEK